MAELAQISTPAGNLNKLLPGTSRLPGKPAASADEARKNLAGGSASGVENRTFTRKLVKIQSEVSSALTLRSSQKLFEQLRGAALSNRTDLLSLNQNFSSRLKRPDNAGETTRQNLSRNRTVPRTPASEALAKNRIIKPFTPGTGTGTRNSIRAYGGRPERPAQPSQNNPRITRPSIGKKQSSTSGAGALLNRVKPGTTKNITSQQTTGSINKPGRSRTNPIPQHQKSQFPRIDITA